MSTQADYTPDEWQVLVRAPAEASTLVVKSDQSGGITGRFGVMQESKDARAALENIANTTPVGLVHETAQAMLEQPSWKAIIDNASPETITQTLTRANDILERKAAPDEAQAYRRFVFDVATKTASATKESSGVQTSDKEKVALQQIASMLHLNG